MGAKLYQLYWEKSKSTSDCATKNLMYIQVNFLISAVVVLLDMVAIDVGKNRKYGKKNTKRINDDVERELLSR